MPTILLIKSWRVVIYPNDHRPPHVHVIGPTEHARFELLCDLGLVRILSNISFTTAQLRQIENRLLSNLTLLCNQWGRIHGH